MPTDPDQVVLGSPRDLLRESFVTGLAVVVPIVITLVVLAFVFNQIYQYLNLFSDIVVALPFTAGVLSISGETLVEILTPVVLLVSIFAVGLVVNSSRYGERAVDYFDYVMASLPGVGSVYESFRQMSDVMLDSDTQNFREVKLVEFPHEGAYTLGFVTTETPEPIAAPTDHEGLLTLFLPLAPNPVMGGHLVHVPAERVMDVDMTVEEGVRAVVTSGVAVGGASAESPGLSSEQMRSLATVAQADQRLDPTASANVHRPEDAETGAERRDRYDERVDPTHAGTPESIARREREEDEAGDDMDGRPAARASRHEDERDDTAVRPAELADRSEDERDDTETPPAAAAGRDESARERTDVRPAAVGGEDEATSDAGRDGTSSDAGRDGTTDAGRDGTSSDAGPDGATAGADADDPGGADQTTGAEADGDAATDGEEER